MPTRYTDYDQQNTGRSSTRPAQGGSGYAPRESARPYPERRHADSSAGSSSGSAPRPSLGEYDAPRPQRSYSYDSGTRRTSSYGQGSYAGGQRRPAQNGPRPAGSGQQARPYGQSSYSGQRRPANPYPQGSGAPRRNPQQGGYSQNAQRRPAQPGASRSAGPQQRRPVQGGYARNYSGYSESRPQGSIPVAKIITGVLCVALIITICLAITSKIRSNEPQPVISQNTGMSVQETMVPAEVQATDIPQATDAPQITNAPAQQQETVSTGSRSVTIRAIGDVIIMDEMLDTALVDKKSKTYDFSPLFSMASGIMSEADWTIINIEATLREGKYGYKGYPQFSTPHSILQDLKNVGVDMLTMCNNHMLDGYFDGLKMSLDYVDEAGLKHVGAYRSQAEYDTPEIYELGGIRVGMLNYTDSLNSMDKHSDEEATEYGLRRMKNADYAGDIADLRDAGAEAVVVFMHWGEEYMRYPEESTENTARKLIAAGADIVVGGHPHVVQPAEYVTATDASGNSRTGLVLYSMGNFISNHRHENAPHTDNGVILEFTLTDNGAGGIDVVNPCVIPVYVWRMGTEGNYDYRVLPSGQYLDNPPAGMSAEEYARMQESWNQTVELMGGVVPVIAG